MKSLLVAVSVLFSLSAHARVGTDYRCEGEVMEIFSGQAYGGEKRYTTKELIGLTVASKYIRLSGTSVLYPVPNYMKHDWGRLDICADKNKDITFDNYGCNFEKNIIHLSREVTEGLFNQITNQLTLTQYRKYKIGAEKDPHSYMKRGVYQCSQKY